MPLVGGALKLFTDSSQREHFSVIRTSEDTELKPKPKVRNVQFFVESIFCNSGCLQFRNAYIAVPVAVNTDDCIIKL